MSNSRRKFLKQSTSLAAFSAFGLNISGCQSHPEPDILTQNPNWPIEQGPNTPKFAIIGGTPSEERANELKRIGITNVLIDTGQIPWNKEDIQRKVDQWGEYDISVIDSLPLRGFDDTEAVRGGEGRDRVIDDVKESIRVAGEVGIPTIEYHWWNHRLTEGYYHIEGRGGSSLLAYDYSKAKDLPPENGEKTMETEELWDNYEYFLKEIIPVAEEAGVGMAVHPNDPPAAISRGHEQILITFDGFKRMVNLVDSPANGMTAHPGFYNELGIDDLEVIRYLAERDRINFCHYRNTRSIIPSEKYVETFPESGQVDMFACMRELIRQDYTGAIYPEHPVGLPYNGDQEGATYTGLAYNKAYATAMMQAALMVEGKV